MSSREQVLNVRISNAAEIVWEGAAHSVSSENAQGPFDILPMHENFITLVKDKPINIVTAEGKTMVQHFPVSVIYNVGDTVRIFTDITKISL